MDQLTSMLGTRPDGQTTLAQVILIFVVLFWMLTAAYVVLTNQVPPVHGTAHACCWIAGDGRVSSCARSRWPHGHSARTGVAFAIGFFVR
jgi:hypothetical protein